MKSSSVFETCDSWHMMNDLRHHVRHLHQGGGVALLAGGPAQPDVPRQNWGKKECAARTRKAEASAASQLLYQYRSM